MLLNAGSWQLLCMALSAACWVGYGVKGNFPLLPLAKYPCKAELGRRGFFFPRCWTFLSLLTGSQQMLLQLEEGSV